MEDHVLTHWIYAAAALLLSVSLIFKGGEKRTNALRKAASSIASYFFSFSPFVLLAYLLYKISHMQ